MCSQHVELVNKTSSFKTSSVGQTARLGGLIAAYFDIQLSLVHYRCSWHHQLLEVSIIGVVGTTSCWKCSL